MNEKLTIRQLAALLPEDVFGRDNERRTALVSEIFALIADSLAEGENVNIKGLGEFRPSGGDDGMVTFVPDATFDAVVNAPFAGFAPVELAPEYTEELLEPVTALEAEEITPESPEAETEHEPEVVPEPEPEAVQEPEVVSEPEPEPASVPAPAPEPVRPIAAPEPVTVPAPEPEATPQAVRPTTEPEPIRVPEPVIKKVESETAPAPEHEVEETRDSRFGSGFFWGLLTGLVIGALLFLLYVMLTSDVAPADAGYILDEATASAAFDAME